MTTRGASSRRLPLVEGTGWLLRRGCSSRLFSDRLVVQGGSAGFLELSISLLAGRRASSAWLGLLAVLAAASTSEGIRRDTGIVSWLHWPNLVTIDGLVVANTSLSLVEPGPPGWRRIQGERSPVRVSVQVNCFADPASSFPSISLPATSISKVLGVEIDVDMLRDKILQALNWYHAEWEREMNLKLVERIQPTIVWLGRDVEVKLARGATFRGRAKSLDDLGSLLLERDDEGPSARRRMRRRTQALSPLDVERVRPLR